MLFWSIIRNLKFSQVYRVIVWFLLHPLFMFATIKATYITMKIAQKEFPDIHNKLNKANAFRHALWNFLIANQCSQFSFKLDSILDWTKKITDWHEEFSPNKEMAKLMDLHNNKIGRERFKEVGRQPRDKIVNILIDELSLAVLIRNRSDFQNFENNLVYLES